MSVNNTIYPKQGLMKKLAYILKYHFHVMLYFYVWFGLFVCGLVAPEHRVAGLKSAMIAHGWQLSLLASLIVLPWPIIYLVRFKTASKNMPK